MTIADVWTTPDHFPLRIDLAANTVTFVPLSQTMYRDLSFLDDRYISLAGKWEARLDEVEARFPLSSPNERRPVHCVFHIAFCGSTFISRCLDRLSGALVLKEPFPLHDLGHLKRHDPSMRLDPRAWQTAFTLLMALLGRTYSASQVAIVKPTDACTHLIEDTLAYAPCSAALFLHVGLAEFLPAVLGDTVRRGFVRDRLDDLAVLYPGTPPFDDESRRALTDGERAACLWLLHMRLYGDFVQQHRDARCRSLDFAHFLARPSETLEEVARLFGVAYEPGEIDAAIDAETGVHSKERQTRFTAADRHAALRTASEQSLRRHRGRTRLGRAPAGVALDPRHSSPSSGPMKEPRATETRRHRATSLSSLPREAWPDLIVDFAQVTKALSGSEGRRAPAGCRGH